MPIDATHEEALAELRRRQRGGPVPQIPTWRYGWRFPYRIPSRNEALKAATTEELVEHVKSEQKVVYGADDRIDIFEVADSGLLRDADGVCALISTKDISQQADGSWTVDSSPLLGDARNLCSTEPFRGQPSVANCSGFLVDPSLVVTAGHCLNAGNLSNWRFVFDWEMIDATTPPGTLDADDVYSGIRIVGRALTGTDDWAVVQLDRPVLNRVPLEIRRRGRVPDNQAVHVIGHPSGIPKKYAGGANVRDNTPAAFFVANLDTYGGNSGSPVFNADTHVVEGVLVRGETDYVANGSCNVSLVCSTNGCRGEDVTRTTQFDNLVPPQRQDCIRFDPAQLQVRRIRGRWKIVDGRMWLLDFAGEEAEARRSLEVLQHYGMNSQCFVGRPNPSMEYFLVDGQAPTGALPGEDCIQFDPNQLEVTFVSGRWKIVEGNHWLMDFDQAEDEARQALSTILRHGFRYSCFVGRPQPTLHYWKK